MFLIGCSALLDIFVYWRTTSALFFLLLLSVLSLSAVQTVTCFLFVVPEVAACCLGHVN